jgi:hypothetical protein
MDWLGERQPGVEAALAKRHLAEGGLVLYDLTSVYLEGSKCELARRGYSRDGKRGLPQIEFGIITNAASGRSTREPGLVERDRRSSQVGVSLRVQVRPTPAP